jgi:hypothetical protein
MLIIETGTAAADSEVLCSVAFADTYHANLGNTLWATLLTAEKEAALRRGYLYMQQTYRLRWAGYRVKDTQALDWPRYYVPRTDIVSGYAGNIGGFGGFGSSEVYYPSDAIPKEVQQAQAELAFKAASGELLSDVEQPVASESVGPISVTYFQGDTKTKRYPAIDRLLSPFVGSGSNIKVMRA